jgi:hypothetical protein
MDMLCMTTAINAVAGLFSYSHRPRLADATGRRGFRQGGGLQALHPIYVVASGRRSLSR